MLSKEPRDAAAVCIQFSLTFKALHGLAPSYLADLCSYIQTEAAIRHSRRTHHQLKLSLTSAPAHLP